MSSLIKHILFKNIFLNDDNYEFIINSNIVIWRKNLDKIMFVTKKKLNKKVNKRGTHDDPVLSRRLFIKKEKKRLNFCQ